MESLEAKEIKKEALYTRKSVQALLNISESTVAQIFNDMRAKKLTIGQSEMMFGDDLIILLRMIMDTGYKRI